MTIAAVAFRPAPAASQATLIAAGLALAPLPLAGDRTGDASAPVEAVADGELLLPELTIRTAEQLVGTSYRWGGESPAEGFDCSGFVRYVYAQHAIELPRTSRAQARAGASLPPSLDDLRPGDLLFFAQRGPGIDHVAIYAGGGRIIHASRNGRGVRYDDFDGDRGRWYAQHLVAVRRVIPEAGR